MPESKFSAEHLNILDGLLDAFNQGGKKERNAMTKTAYNQLKALYPTNNRPKKAQLKQVQSKFTCVLGSMADCNVKAYQRLVLQPYNEQAQEEENFPNKKMELEDCSWI
jgi:hypothetical protein